MGHLCHCQLAGCQNNKTQHFKFDFYHKADSITIVWDDFFKSFVIDIVPKGMNEKVAEEVTCGEFLLFLEIWLLMATLQGPEDRKDHWSTQNVACNLKEHHCGLLTLCSSRGSTTSSSASGALTKHHWLTLTSSMKCERYWWHGTPMCRWCSLLCGSLALTNQCCAGQVNSLAQGSCLFQGSLSLLVKSVTPSTVLCVEYCLEWSHSKERMHRINVVNLTTKTEVGRQWDHHEIDKIYLGNR